MPLCFRKELCEIIKSMLCIDVSQRPSIGDILQKLLSIQPTGEDSPAIESRCARIFSTEQFHPAANGPCKATLLPPTPCEAAPLPPTSCQDTPLAQTSCKATILPSTSARRRISEPVTPYVFSFYYINWYMQLVSDATVCADCLFNCIAYM